MNRGVQRAAAQHKNGKRRAYAGPILVTAATLILLCIPI
jgi:hypothetical protein